MTNDQRTALAREHAEEATKADASDPNLSASDLNGIKHDVAEYAEEVITFLLRRFYLVEKNKVSDEYKTCASLRDGNLAPNIESAIRHHRGIEGLRVLKSLFPEIAKEAEND